MPFFQLHSRSIPLLQQAAFPGCGSSVWESSQLPPLSGHFCSICAYTFWGRPPVDPVGVPPGASSAGTSPFLLPLLNPLFKSPDFLDGSFLSTSFHFPYYRIPSPRCLPLLGFFGMDPRSLRPCRGATAVNILTFKSGSSEVRFCLVPVLETEGPRSLSFSWWFCMSLGLLSSSLSCRSHSASSGSCNPSLTWGFVWV